MPVTNHQNYSQGKLTLKEIRKKETKDGTGNIIKYLQAVFNYDHPINGSTIKGNPNFEICPVTTPIGFVKENYKLSSFSTFDITDPEVQDCIDIKERTQIKGWVKCDDNVELKMGIKNSVATSKAKIDVYNSPDDDGKVVSSVEENTVMQVENQNDEGTWLLVVTGGKEGFFSKVYNDVAKIIFDNRAACGLASLSKLEDIKSRMKAPVYWHRDKETGAFIEGKNPSAYLKHTYFSAQPARGDKPAMSERYADFKTPLTGDEKLSLDILMNSALTFRPVVALTNVYIGAGKITPQFYVSSAVVTDIKKIEKVHQQQGTLERYSKNKELMKKLEEQLAASKGFTEERKQEQDNIEKSRSTPDSPLQEGSQQNLQDFLSGGPKKETVNLEPSNNDDDDDDIEIKGLPSL